MTYTAIINTNGIQLTHLKEWQRLNVWSTGPHNPILRPTLKEHNTYINIQVIKQIVHLTEYKYNKTEIIN